MGQPNSNQSFLTQFYHIWITERPSLFAAMLAYYALFSFVPLIYIVLTVAGVFIDELRAASQLYAWVGENLGPESSQLLQDQMNRLAERSTGGMTVETVIGFAVLLGTASLLFFQLQYALNSIWKLPPPQRGATRFLILNRLLAFLIVIGLGLLLVVTTLANTVVAGLCSWIGLSGTLPVASLLSSILLLTFMLAVLYKVLPNALVAWRDVLVGSLVAAVLLTLAGSLLGVYLGASDLSSASGAAGAVAVFLMAFYFIGLIIVVGAVFIRVYASLYGSRILPRSEPEPGGSTDKLPAEGGGQPPETPLEQSSDGKDRNSFRSGERTEGWRGRKSFDCRQCAFRAVSRGDISEERDPLVRPKRATLERHIGNQHYSWAAVPVTKRAFEVPTGHPDRSTDVCRVRGTARLTTPFRGAIIAASCSKPRAAGILTA